MLSFKLEKKLRSLGLKSGDKIAPNIGIDIAKNDRSNILSLVFSDSFWSANSSWVFPGVARLSKLYLTSSK